MYMMNDVTMTKDMSYATTTHIHIDLRFILSTISSLVVPLLCHAMVNSSFGVNAHSHTLSLSLVEPKNTRYVDKIDSMEVQAQAQAR